MTGADLEAAAADSIKSFVRRKPRPFTEQGRPCANCGTPLEGWWCHVCGQNADTHHRSILHLTWEAIEGMFHLDGRLAQTLPLLFFRPGVLAKDLMEGRIVRHAPPFRTFLVALLLFIFAAEHAIHKVQHNLEHAWEERAERMKTPEGRKAEAERLRAQATLARTEAIKALAETRDEAIRDKDATAEKAQADYAVAGKLVQQQYDKAIARAANIETDPAAAMASAKESGSMGKAAADQVRALDISSATGDSVKAEVKVGGAKTSAVDAAWFREQIAKALENPEYYFTVMFGWAHRLAVLLLPILGLSLTLVYLNRRQFYVYDHLLVATNLLSFAFLTNALGLVLPWSVGKYWFLLLMFWTPVNLYQTLRGGYGSTVIGAIFKAGVVWFVSVTAFTTLLLALMFFTLSQL